MTFITGNIVVENSLSANSITVSGTVINKDGLLIKDMMMSTGAYAFSGITIGTGTTFNVGGVRGFIIDATDPLNVIPQFVSYSGASGLTTPFLTASSATYIMLNSANTLTYSTTEPSLTQRRQNIALGVVAHPNGVLTGAGNRPDIGIATMSQIRDMFQPIRYINDGVVPYPNSTNLTLANTAGVLYSLGIGFVPNGPLRPSSIDIVAGAPTTFQYRTQTGGTFANTTTISAATYDVGGTATAVPGGGATSTNQRIFLLENGVIRIQFGQNSYASLTLAIDAINTETFIPTTNARLGILIGILSVTKNCTDLSDTATAKFFTVSKFGETVGATAGVSTGTLQVAYNNSVSPEITTNTTLGAVSIQRGSASDNDRVLEILNGSGAIKFSVDGMGDLSASTYAGATGVTNNSPNGFVHGRNSSAGTANDICILGPNLIGTASGFTYVNALNIKQIGVGPSSVDLGLDANGNVVNQISDVTYKENISTIENALDKVRNLRGVQYQWKDRNCGGHEFRLGFVAQEVNQVEPMLVTNLGGDLLGVQYKDVPALLVEAIKELASGTITTGVTYLETQTILAEDNNIQLNFNGNVLTAVGGGLEVLHALGEGVSAELKIDTDGNWISNNDIKPYGIVVPYYTPSSSDDITGNNGNITRDEDYLYIKTSYGWKRTNLESF